MKMKLPHIVPLSRQAIELLQLAHLDENTVRAAYNHALHLKERRLMMQAWADYLDTLRKGRHGQCYRRAERRQYAVRRRLSEGRLHSPPRRATAQWIR
jgi:hypothetical protein